MDSTWYESSTSQPLDVKLRLIECLTASSRFKSEPLRLSRTLGSDLLALATYESWELKTDNFCVMANVSRPTGRKLARNYLEFGVAQADQDGNLFASTHLKRTFERRAEQFLLEAQKHYSDPIAITEFNIKRLAHALARYDHAGATGLLPGNTASLLGLLQVFFAQQTTPRRTRNILQAHYELTGDDLEPAMRRWIMLGWVNASDDHFFNDRVLTTSSLGEWVCNRVLNTLSSCLIRVDFTEFIRP